MFSGRAAIDDLRSTSSKKPLYFCCCNRLGKFYPDEIVTKFLEYPWSPDDQVLVDELCPWHQYYYTFLPPFFRPYDGPIQHRLVKLLREMAGFTSEHDL